MRLLLPVAIGTICLLELVSSSSVCGKHGSWVPSISACKCNDSWSGSFCEIVPSCGSGIMQRCEDGSCDSLADDDSCPSTLDACDSLQVRCPDGECHETCPAYNGCPLESPISCPDGRCTTSLQNCSGDCSSNAFKCWDFRCTYDPSTCIQPPFAVKPAVQRFTVNANVSGWARVAAVNSDSDLSLVQLVGPDIVSSDASSFALTVGPVADSIIANVVAAPNWQVGVPVTQWVFSPVLNFSTTAGCRDPLPVPLGIKLLLTLPARLSMDMVCVSRLSIAANRWECLDMPVQLTDSIVDTSIPSLNAIYALTAVNFYGVAGGVVGDPAADPFTQMLQQSMAEREQLNLYLALLLIVLFAIAAGSILGYWRYRRASARPAQIPFHLDVPPDINQSADDYGYSQDDARGVGV